MTTPAGIESLTGGLTAKDVLARASRLRALLDSTSVRGFRGFASSVTLADEGPQRITPQLAGWSLATGLSGSLIDYLDGDALAVRKLGAHLARKQARITRASYVPVQFVDCWGLYMDAMGAAWNEYLSCIAGTMSQWVPFGEYYCAASYYARGESYWFQFLACSAVNIPH